MDQFWEYKKGLILEQLNRYCQRFHKAKPNLGGFHKASSWSKTIVFSNEHMLAIQLLIISINPVTKSSAALGLRKGLGTSQLLKIVEDEIVK